MKRLFTPAVLLLFLLFITLFCKFKDPVASTQFSAGNEYPFYKYSDILLFYAEAASRVNNGPNALAMERLNMVHRRAYGLSATAVSAIDFRLTDYPTAQSFLDLVVKERGYETAYEALAQSETIGHRATGDTTGKRENCCSETPFMAYSIIRVKL